MKHPTYQSVINDLNQEIRSKVKQWLKCEPGCEKYFELTDSIVEDIHDIRVLKQRLNRNK